MKKRIFSLLLAACILIAVMPVQALSLQSGCTEQHHVGGAYTDGAYEPSCTEPGFTGLIIWSLIMVLLIPAGVLVYGGIVRYKRKNRS